MNPKYLGDSYDFVKRFFINVIKEFGYEVSIDPRFTGEWEEQAENYEKILGAKIEAGNADKLIKRACFIDPDTGVMKKRTKHHISFVDISKYLDEYEIVFAFDQSFSRSKDSRSQIANKLNQIQSLGRYAVYYDSHAKFIFAASSEQTLKCLVLSLIDAGLPRSRLIEFN